MPEVLVPRKTPDALRPVAAGRRARAPAAKPSWARPRQRQAVVAAVELGKVAAGSGASSTPGHLADVGLRASRSRRRRARVRERARAASRASRAGRGRCSWSRCRRCSTSGVMRASPASSTLANARACAHRDRAGGEAERGEQLAPLAERAAVQAQPAAAAHERHGAVDRLAEGDSRSRRRRRRRAAAARPSGGERRAHASQGPLLRR